MTKRVVGRVSKRHVRVAYRLSRAQLKLLDIIASGAVMPSGCPYDEEEVIVRRLRDIELIDTDDTNLLAYITTDGVRVLCAAYALGLFVVPAPGDS